MPPSRFGSSVLSFPPFSGVTKKLVLTNLAVYALTLFAQWSAPLTALLLSLALRPIAVVHGAVWQLLTYAFLQTGILQILFNMLSLWFIGSYLETAKGPKWLTEIYFLSVIGGALIATGLSFSGILHLTPTEVVAGASSGIFGMLAAFAVLFGEQQFMMFPLPIGIKAKYLVIIYILIAVASVFSGVSPLTYVTYLAGALLGYLYSKGAPRRGFAGSASEKYFGARNDYYRWKRRQAAKKFEVYMSKQGRDVKFDKEGRYIDPDDRSKWN
jgi:membrane associated rhomboid family serine protease